MEVLLTQIVSDFELDSTQLVARLKNDHPGKVPGELYGLFVKARALKPEIGMKDFVKLFNATEPNGYRSTELIAVTPTHRDTFLGILVHVTPCGGFHRLIWENGMTGTDPGELSDRYVPLA